MPVFFVIKSSSKKHPWLFFWESHHIIELMTVCVFFAFYCKWLNTWDEHVIKSETHSNSWKLSLYQYTEAIESKIWYFLTCSNVNTHSASQQFVSIKKYFECSFSFKYIINKPHVLGENHFTVESDGLDNLEPSGAGKTNRPTACLSINLTCLPWKKLDLRRLNIAWLSSQWVRWWKGVWKEKTACCYKRLCSAVNCTVIYLFVWQPVWFLII